MGGKSNTRSVLRLANSVLLDLLLCSIVSLTARIPSVSVLGRRLLFSHRAVV